jgi:hypothetical protein
LLARERQGGGAGSKERAANEGADGEIAGGGGGKGSGGPVIDASIIESVFTVLEGILPEYVACHRALVGSQFGSLEV